MSEIKTVLSEGWLPTEEMLKQGLLSLESYESVYPYYKAMITSAPKF